jgi:hypothetical protein
MARRSTSADHMSIVFHSLRFVFFVGVRQYHIVKGLPIDANSQKLIDATTKELQEEKKEASAI